jgi:hypothetical protein
MEVDAKGKVSTSSVAGPEIAVYLSLLTVIFLVDQKQYDKVRDLTICPHFL